MHCWVVKMCLLAKENRKNKGRNCEIVLVSKYIGEAASKFFEADSNLSSCLDNLKCCFFHPQKNWSLF